MGPNTNCARSYSSSDEDLLPLEALRPWAYKGVRSPAKQREKIPDPAEDALEGRKTVRKPSSSLTSTSRSASASLSPEPRCCGEKKQQTPLPPVPDGREDPVTSTSKPAQTPFRRTTSTFLATRRSRHSSIVPDSETQDVSEKATLGDFEAALASQKLSSALFGHKWSSTFIGESPETPATMPVSVKPSSYRAAVTETVYSMTSASRVVSMQTTSTPSHSRRDKNRRLTIITILDSDEEAEQAASNPATPNLLSPPALLRWPSTASSSGENTPDEVSVADYSDKEEELAPPPATRIIDVDSSDSESDRIAGVLVW